MTVWSSLALSDILLLGNICIQSKTETEWFLKFLILPYYFVKKESQERLREVIWLGSSIGLIMTDLGLKLAMPSLSCQPFHNCLTLSPSHPIFGVTSCPCRWLILHLSPSFLRFFICCDFRTDPTSITPSHRTSHHLLNCPPLKYLGP